MSVSIQLMKKRRNEIDYPRFFYNKKKKKGGIKGTYQTFVCRRMALTLLYDEKQKKDDCINP
jgi:hypothetical protein